MDRIRVDLYGGKANVKLTSTVERKRARSTAIFYCDFLNGFF